MASIPYFILSPSAIISFVGLLHGPDKTVPTPVEDYRKATVDMVIPARNEEKSIVLCLESIAKQTVKPNNIILYDDGSSDQTSLFAERFAESIGLNLKMVRREKCEGKTPSVHAAAHESQADVLFVLDADTILRSENYIEKLVQELYQGVGIACACGVILPEFERDRTVLTSSTEVSKFSQEFPDVKKPRDTTWFQRLQHSITNNYREELYLFLQKFIYHGEMVFFGCIINPVGCAVAYRRKYLIDVLDHYGKDLGHNLTTSEDIFIGFAFADKGYRNVQVQNTYALTLEPRLSKLPRQIMMWSSAFLQSCYYFDNLVRTPFKIHRVLIRKIRDKFNPATKETQEKRKIKEAYRQSFGEQLTQKYGRPIGWFMFTSMLEKISFPTVILMMLIMGFWKALALTILLEVIIYTIMIGFMHKNRRFRNIIKSICYTPIRYAVLVYDYFVILNFAIELWITKKRTWKK